MTTTWLSEFIERPSIPTPYLPELPDRACETIRLLPAILGSLMEHYEQNKDSIEFDIIHLDRHIHLMICRMVGGSSPDLIERCLYRRWLRYLPVLSLLRDTYLDLSVKYMPATPEDVERVKGDDVIEEIKIETQIHEGLLAYLLIYEDDHERLEQGLLDFTN